MNILSIRSDLAAAARRRLAAFSLVEMLAAVAIIGVISFLAIPSITRMRMDSERNLAVSRAEALNVAQASMIQVEGRTQADLRWRGASGNEAKYSLLRPYLSYAETSLAAYMPSGYSITFNPSITSLQKAALFGPEGQVAY